MVIENKMKKNIVQAGFVDSKPVTKEIEFYPHHLKSNASEIEIQKLKLNEIV